MAANNQPVITVDDLTILLQAFEYLKRPIMSDFLSPSYRDSLQEVASKLGVDKETLTVDGIKQLMDQLQMEFEEKHGLYAADVDPNQFLESLRDGIFKLQDSAQLVNPFTIIKLEKAYRLPVTGCLDQLVKGWNQRYYSSRRCAEFNPDGARFHKIIEYGDIQAFEDILPKLMSMPGWQAVIHMIVQNNHVEMTKMALDALESTPQPGSRLSFEDAVALVGLAFRSNRNTIDVMEYLFERYGSYGINANQIITVSQGQTGCEDNVRYYMSLPGVGRESLSRLLMSVMHMSNLFMDILHMVESTEPIGQQQLGELYTTSYLDQRYETADFLRSRLGPDYDIRGLFFTLTDFARGGDSSGFEKIINEPEVTREIIIEAFQRPNQYPDMGELDASEIAEYSEKTLDIAVQSGKVTEDEVAAFRM